MAQSVVSRDISRIDGDRKSVEDRVAVEEPLEIRVAGETIAVTMRTPGQGSVADSRIPACRRHRH